MSSGGDIGSQSPDPNSKLILPPGRYVAEANANFFNASPTGEPVTANCDLRFDRSGVPVFIDVMDVLLDVPGPAGDDQQRITISGAFEIQPGDGPLRVSCLADPVDYEDLDIFAIRVETLTEAGQP